MEKQLNICRYVLIGVLFLFLVVFIVMSNNYNEVIATNEQLMFTIEDNREHYNTNIENMYAQYNDLMVKYTDIHSENGVLKTKIESPNKCYGFTEAEIRLIAKCVQAEAGSADGHDVSQKYITQVILNRLYSSDFPDTIEEVIYQIDGNVPQFSTAYDGAIDNVKLEPETLVNVYSVLMYGCDLPSYVTYSYSASVEENWVCTLNTYDEAQGTVFAYYKAE